MHYRQFAITSSGTAVLRRAGASFVVSTFLLLISAAPVSAGVVAQVDFQESSNGGTETPITRNPAGSSDLATLVGSNTSINTGPTGLGSLYTSEVRFGFLDVNGPGGGSGGVRSTNTSGSNAQVQDYLGQGSQLGEGAILTVFRPNFDGIQTGRRTLVGHDIQQNDQIWLFNNDNVDGPTLRLGANGQQGANLPNFVWDSDTWYVIAGAWRTTPNGSNVDIEVNIYARDLSSRISPAEFSTEFYLNQSNGPMNDSFYVGIRDAISEAADGDIALFRMYDTFFTEAQFDQVFASFIVPEPSSLSLFAVAAAGFCRLRRRKLAN